MYYLVEISDKEFREFRELKEFDELSRSFEESIGSLYDIYGYNINRIFSSESADLFYTDNVVNSAFHQFILGCMAAKGLPIKRRQCNTND